MFYEYAKLRQWSYRRSGHRQDDQANHNKGSKTGKCKKRKHFANSFGKLNMHDVSENVISRM